jgi:crotonobetainyl-CoA:carnitine CoA-transferase CaiB-like acyl-CoA transferase
MTDNVYAMLAMPLSRYSATGTRFSGGADWLTGGTPCYEVYATSDGRHLAVGALEPKFWSSFCKAIARKDLIAQQFPDTPEGVREVKAQVQAVLAKHTAQHWQSFFQDKDCCVEIGQHCIHTRRGAARAHMSLIRSQHVIIEPPPCSRFGRCCGCVASSRAAGGS